MASFSLIVAATRLGLPWPRLADDMKLFRSLTTKVVDEPSTSTPSSPLQPMNAVIMGRKTWASIPEAHRPLKDRLSIVITSSPNAIAKA